MDDESELVSVYYGADVTEEDAEAIVAELEELYPNELKVFYEDDYLICFYFKQKRGINMTNREIAEFVM